MLNKLKFIPLIFLFVTSLFSLEIYSTVPYDYRLRITDAGDMWLYNGIIRDVVHYCQYTQVENNPNYVTRFNETSFKEKSFYSYKDPHTVGFIAYNAGLIDPGSLFRFMGYDKKPCSAGSSETCNFLKYETYDHATIPGTSSVNCVSCDTSKGEYFDSTTGLCVNKCEDITNQNDRLDCMCKRAGKIGYTGNLTTMFIGGDGSTICSYRCKTTKDDPEARPNGDGTEFGVSYDIKDTDPNANGVCFTDDTYAPNAVPAPNPKPDDPGNNNGTKPGGDTPKPDNPNPDKPDKPDPDKPNQGGGGHPGGGSNPGNNNGTKPGNPDNNNGTKPGKDDNQGKFDPKDFDDGGLDKARDGLYDSIKNHLENGISKFDGVRDGIDQFISNVKGKGFAKVKSDIKRSCPIKKEIQLPDGKARELVVDYCDAVAPASEVSYYVFYVFFIVGIFLLLLKLFVVLI